MKTHVVHRDVLPKKPLAIELVGEESIGPVGVSLSVGNSAAVNVAKTEQEEQEKNRNPRKDP